MKGEIYNEHEEEEQQQQKIDKSQKVSSETDLVSRKPKKLKSKSCTHCKKLKLKFQELEQLNTKLMQTNKNLKQ